MSNRRKRRSAHDKPITDVALVQPNTRGSGIGVVVLDRVEPDVEPDYCTHGKVTCYGDCGEWCWLGSETFPLVKSGEYAGLCRQCAARMIPPGTRPVRRVEDHR